MTNIYVILLISVLGPVLGSLIGVLKKPSETFMHRMLAFAAGVMLSISFLELIPEGIRMSSLYIASLGVLTGSLFMLLLDRSIPHIHPELCSQEQGCDLKRTSVYLMVGIFLHNLPEGMAIAIGSVTDTSTGLAIALAIGVHNIPEGICTSAPYYFCTKKKLRSFLLSSATAIPILVGFIIADILFRNIPLAVVGFLIAATAGIMIYISGDELIPNACNKKQPLWDHMAIFSLIFGVIFVILLGSVK